MYLVVIMNFALYYELNNEMVSLRQILYACQKRDIWDRPWRTGSGTVCSDHNFDRVGMTKIMYSIIRQTVLQKKTVWQGHTSR